MVGFKPFQDDSAALTVGGLEIENGTQAIAIHGSLDITRDREGLGRAKRLRDVLAAAVTALEGMDDLPESPAAAEATVGVKNPFG